MSNIISRVMIHKNTRKNKFLRVCIIGCVCIAIIIVGCFAIFPPAQFAFKQLIQLLLSYTTKTNEHIDNINVVSDTEVKSHVTAADKAVNDIDVAHREYANRIIEHNKNVDKLTEELSSSAASNNEMHKALSQDVANILNATYVETSDMNENVK